MDKETRHAHEDIDPAVIFRIVEKHGQDRGTLIAALEEIQTAYGYLPEQALRIVADKTGCSLVNVYGVATFYRTFSLKPRGKHLICACLGTACHVRGAARIVEELENQLGIKSGETTPDKEFTMETVNCLGACALGPVLVLDGHYYPKVRKSQVGQLLQEARKGFEKTDVDRDERIFPVEVSCSRCNHSLMDKTVAIDGYPSILVNTSFGNKHGWLRLSSLYGSYSISTEHALQADIVMELSCPHCRKELAGTWKCPMCGSPMAPMSVRGGGMLQICERLGCQGHMLDLNRPTQ